MEVVGFPGAVQVGHWNRWFVVLQVLLGGSDFGQNGVFDEVEVGIVPGSVDFVEVGWTVLKESSDCLSQEPSDEASDEEGCNECCLVGKDHHFGLEG